MNKKERYYYEQGKHEGFIEGQLQGNQFIVEYINKKLTPKIIIHCDGKTQKCRLFQNIPII